MILFLTLALAITVGYGERGEGKANLVIISPHPETIKMEFTRAFKGWYKEWSGDEVELEWLDQGGTSDDLRYVRSEFRRTPGGIGIDIFFGGGTSPFLVMAEEGLLQPYKLPDEVLSKIPQQIHGVPIYDPKYRWYGTVLSGFGIMVNKMVKSYMNLPDVERWEDLGDPGLLGQVSAADPRKSGSAHMMFELILQSTGWEKGWEIITRMGGNARTFTAGSNEAVRDVSTGETAYALAIDFYAYTQMAAVGEDKIGYIVPKGCVVYNADSIAILKGAPHLDVAQKFLEFVMSEHGQKLWMLKSGDPEGPKEFSLFRSSVIPSLYDKLAGRTVIKVNPFKTESLFKYDAKKGGDRWTLVNDLIGALVIDTHDELVRAWKAVIKGGMKEEALAELVKVPITEDEAMRMARERWKDQAFRNTKITEWTNFARRKYARARKLAR
jgi:ABC-type Fe3+ transport system substrate-binding protein